jgi:hypothetical protein
MARCEAIAPNVYVIKHRTGLSTINAGSAAATRQEGSSDTA